MKVTKTQLDRILKNPHVKIRQEKPGNRVTVSASNSKSNTEYEFATAHGIQTFDSKVSVSFHCKRHRLIDEDNFIPKFVIDAIRYQGILREDTPKEVHYAGCTQEKIPKTEAEETIMKIVEI